MAALDDLATWPAPCAAAVVGPDGSRHTIGDITRPFALASVTKLLTAMAALVAHEEGTLDLDEELTPAGSTVADLLSHAGGIAPDRPEQLAAPRSRRMYSTASYDIIAGAVGTNAGIPFAQYLTEAVLLPLGMTPHVLAGSAGSGGWGSVTDLLLLAEAWRAPILVAQITLDRAIGVHLPDLVGILPGYGRQTPNPWGLGPERRAEKRPHWTGASNSPATYGHFGQSGTMLWIDPEAHVTLIALCDEPFGPWAIKAWPHLSDAVMAELLGGPGGATNRPPR